MPAPPQGVSLERWFGMIKSVASGATTLNDLKDEGCWVWLLKTPA